MLPTCIELEQNSIDIVLAMKGAERLRVDRAADGHANKMVGMGEHDEGEGQRRRGLHKLSVCRRRGHCNCPAHLK